MLEPHGLEQRLRPGTEQVHPHLQTALNPDAPQTPPRPHPNTPTPVSPQMRTVVPSVSGTVMLKFSPYVSFCSSRMPIATRSPSLTDSM